MSNRVFDTESGHYPRHWDEFVGQEDAAKLLRMSARSAKIRNEPLDHVLIAHGTPGIGKTALAGLVAQEMGTSCLMVSGQLDRTQAGILLVGMGDMDILFYDEFHQVVQGGRGKAEWLLHYLQDGVLNSALGTTNVPRVTIVAATTDPGKIPRTITDRFPLQPALRDYSDVEAAEIAVVLSKRVLTDAGLAPLTIEQANQLALGASGNPRAIRNNLCVLRDLVVTGELSDYDIPALLKWQGITEDGLTPPAQDYLLILVDEFQGRAGLTTMEQRLNQPGGLGLIEQMLLRKGYIVRTRSGREASGKGIERAHRLRADLHAE